MEYKENCCPNEFVTNFHLYLSTFMRLKDKKMGTDNGRAHLDSEHLIGISFCENTFNKWIDRCYTVLFNYCLFV